MSVEIYKPNQLKLKLKALLHEHGFKLYENNGQWCARSNYYDILQFAAFPRDSRPHHLPLTAAEAMK